MTQERPSGRPGTLYLVATPIGNLEDISARALRVLREANLVAAEDTRHTRRLLQHFGIPAQVVSLHEHNERARASSLVERVRAGESVALVTDAGSPGIADPGYPVVRAAVAEGVRVESIPGPSAVIAALQVSGLPTDAFLFAGFLPPRRSARCRRLEELSAYRETVVVFESPHRIEACLEDLETVWAERPIALARELTKLHEQVLRGTPREVRAALRDEWKRGEMVLVLGGRTRAERGRERKPDVLAESPEGEVGGYKVALKRLAHRGADPLVRALLAIGLKPDHLTAIGFLICVVAALEFALGRFRLAATFATLAGVCDILDGQLARMSGKVTRFGAFFDSTLDRVAEAALFVGIAFYYMVQLVDMAANPGRVVANLQYGLEPLTFALISMLAMLALVGSFMVSYSRARAEGLGLDCKVGWFERPERMVLLIIAGYAGLGPVMPAALLVLVVFSFATAIQRMAHVWKLTRDPGSSSTEA